jgi:hypothetical protein
MTKTRKATLARPTLAIGDLTRGDWRAFEDALPTYPGRWDSLVRNFYMLAWTKGANGVVGAREREREIWKALASGSYRAGPFQVARLGRWGICFALDPAYAEQREIRGRRRVQGSGMDVAFERDFHQRVLRMSDATAA